MPILLSKTRFQLKFKCFIWKDGKSCGEVASGECEKLRLEEEGMEEKQFIALREEVVFSKEKIKFNKEEEQYSRY